MAGFEAIPEALLTDFSALPGAKAGDTPRTLDLGDGGERPRSSLYRPITKRVMLFASTDRPLMTPPEIAALVPDTEAPPFTL
jgi:hypothetical protein